MGGIPGLPQRPLPSGTGVEWCDQRVSLGQGDAGKESAPGQVDTGAGRPGAHLEGGRCRGRPRAWRIRASHEDACV